MRVLQRVPTGKERIVQMILNFIAYADPQLDRPRLREALSVPDKTGKDDALDPQSIIREGSITRLCRSLIRESNDGRYYEFAHFSVKEFLEGKMKSMPEFEKFQVSERICQLLLAKQCLKYLLYRDFSSLPKGEAELKDHIEMRMKQHPFYFYAAVCWPVFAKPHWVDAGLVDLAGRLFQPKKTGNFLAWALELTSFVSGGNQLSFQRILSPTDPLYEYHFQQMLRLLPWVIDENFTTLHMAAVLSLEVICSGLIVEGPNIDQKSAFGCPLQCAVLGLILAKNDDELDEIEVYSYHGYWCEEAISPGFGREKTIELLLKAGATHLRACSGLFADQKLITIALEVGHNMDTFTTSSTISIFLEAGHGVEEEDVIQFREFGQTLDPAKAFVEEPYRYNDSLKRLILCLGPMIDRSAAHFCLCQEAWSLAIEIGCEFVQDLSIVDTRISLSQDALAKKIFKAIRDADNETLVEALKDPRANIANVINDHNKTVFETWLEQAESRPTLKMLNVLKTLLSAGMEVNRPNARGLLPLHELAKRFRGTVDDDFYCEALRDVIRDFIRKGTGCIAKSRSNQNVFHHGLWSVSFIRAVLETETDENTLTALRAQDDNGHTPIIHALKYSSEDLALLLLETSSCDLESLRGPASIHAFCVAEGAHRAFNFLLDAGIILDTCSRDGKENMLLHHLGPRTSKEFVLQLTQMFPGGTLCRVDGKLPMDVYLESCITCQRPALDPDVLQLLAACGSDDLDQRQKKLSWEHFMMITQHLNSVSRVAGSPWRWMAETREDILAEAIAILLELGFIQCYEAVAQASGVLPLLKPMRSSLDDLWPISSNAIRGILEQTVFWEALRETAAILRLLKAAVNFEHFNLVELLLENGVGVHQRIDEMSALEMACLKPANHPETERAFTILLNHADASRLDEINPYKGQQRGLLHYLAGPGKQWQLEELLKRGVDVNSRASINIPAQPAIVHHLLAGSSESAITLLENGADPTMTDVCGFDAALAAAFRGNMTFLLHLHTVGSESRQLDWTRTFSGRLPGNGGVMVVVSKIDALHLAAWNGHVDVLEFYADSDLLTDLNTVSAGLFTPMHLAAFNGHVDAIRFLCSRGGGLNLKSADGSLPLHLAVRNGHTDAVKFLVDHGSVIDADIYGLSPLRYAMRLQNQSILDCLGTAKHFSDHQYEPKQHDRDVVHAFEQALIRGDIKFCEMLRSQGFSINVDLPGQRGRSALMVAIEHADEELIKWLLAHDVRATEQALTEDGDAVSPLQAMIRQSRLNDVLPILLQKYQNEGGSAVTERPSLICIAIQHDNTVGLRLLLEHISRNEIDNG